MSDYFRLMETLTKLVSFKTITHDQKAAEACLDYIELFLKDHALYTNRYVSNGFESLIISTQDTKHPKVLLQAHLDVVPAHTEQFRLRQQEGKLYGRGVYDMKFAAACYLELLHHLKDELPLYDLAVMFTMDEEDGGHDGVEYLLNQGYEADICLLPDSGEDWNIEASAKGYSVATITIEGKSAHGSRPWEAENAADKLLACIRSIEKQFPFTAPLENTVTLTVVKAGQAYNQIPGEATACFDIRYTDEASYTGIKERFYRLCRQMDAHVDFRAQAAAIQHDTDSGAFESWQAITTKVRGQAPGFTHSFAASDARYLVPRGIPTISARPKGGGHHGSEEWLNEKDFYDYYEIVKQFVMTTAAHSPITASVMQIDI